MSQSTLDVRGIKFAAGRSAPLTAALAWGAAGRRVHPCRGNKRPFTKWSTSATSAAAGICDLWFKYPGAQVGLCTGDGLLVLDVDKHGADGLLSLGGLETELGFLPETLVASTPAGGKHLFFSYPGEVRDSAGVLGPGLDVRADGGYVIVPSGNSGRAWDADCGPIAELPPAWLARLTKPERPAPAHSPGNNTPPSASEGSYGAKALELEAMAVSSAAEGTRNATLNTAACKLGGLVAAGVLDQVDVEARLLGAALSAGLPESEAVKTIGSGLSAGMATPRAIPEPTFSPRAETPAAQEPKTERKRPIIMTAAQICAMELPPVSWVINDLLPTGLTLLCGKPKCGKSWMALGFGLAVAYGGVALGAREYSATQGAVLMLMLEDTNRRVKTRLDQLLGHEAKPVNLHVSLSWPRADRGGLEEIENFCTANHPRLVVVDTLAKLRPLSGRNPNGYEQDYVHVAALKQIADKYDLGMVVVHHTRKMGAEDVFDTISGTSGLTGAADTNVVLQRARTGAASILSGTGRDIEEFSLALEFDKTSGRWTLLGQAQEVALSSQRQEVLRTLREAGQALGPSALAAALGKPVNGIKQLLFRMTQAGEVLRSDRGSYTL